MKRFLAPFISILVFILLLTSTNYLYQTTKETYIEKDKNRVLKELSQIRAKLEQSINSTFLLINGLMAYVTTHPNLSQKDFKDYSQELMSHSIHIKNITLAPNNIIRYVYPLKGNEAALNLNLLSNPNQKRTVERMLKEKKTVIAGPVTLVQGGEAFINRSPIFINDTYWGMSSIPIKMESIFNDAGLKERSGYLDFALRGKDGLGEKGDVFFGDKSLFTHKESQILDVTLINGYWQLAAKFNHFYQPKNPNWILYIGIILSFAISLLVFYFINTQHTLHILNLKMKKYIDVIDSSVITSTTDLSGNILSVSTAFSQISGYSKNELLGKNHRILKSNEMPQELYHDMWTTISKYNKTWQGEIKNRKKDGTIYWVDATISPIFNEEGKKLGYTSVRQDITDKKIIEEISITDGLTNIYNRRHFNELFPKIINSAKRNNELICFLILDIDHFKQYNDTYGHQMGDKVLQDIAKALQDSSKRADDYCFRLGGEEFGMIFKVDNRQNALEFANKIKENILSLKIEHKNNSASDYVTASMGLVCEHANEIESIDSIYKQADDLLYKSKENGRNKISVKN
ncbi:MAG: diguanylate cyclase [Candidatus Marinarcus sp.]|uniref:diguanylate cyclase n=1 Tax=Candidatus Marinarcus sp. TaxID=3100987 RepID=UPI003AFFCAD8